MGVLFGEGVQLGAVGGTHPLFLPLSVFFFFLALGVPFAPRGGPFWGRVPYLGPWVGPTLKA